VGGHGEKSRTTSQWGACKLVKSESNEIPLDLMRELIKKNLCVLSELCERKKINRMID